CRLELAADSDFADVFEVKSGRPVDPVVTHHDVVGSTLRLSDSRSGRSVAALVHSDDAADVVPAGLSWDVAVPPRSRWSTSVRVEGVVAGEVLHLRYPRELPPRYGAPARRFRAWRARSPLARTGDPELGKVLRRSVEDIGTLRIFDPAHPDRQVVAAGAPWFMAPFGRDALLTSWMILPIDTALALGTLQTLADHQGTVSNSRSDEEPGRIVHELRFGPVARNALGDGHAYYGSADATPLFVMLLGQLTRWRAMDERICDLVPAADRALEWMTGPGDKDGDGFVEYQRASSDGLVNQGWKDSPDGVTFRDGSVATAPIALAEVQGYAYAAFRARARLATLQGDDSTAERWQDRARRLKRRFNDAFWLPDVGWYAMALDGEKRPVDALASNMGHCLWTGIVDDDKAARVAELLVSEELFSGWGVRTLASTMGAYDPLGYHTGTVWPHDTALCVSGLMRYGFVEEAQRIATALFDVATHFSHRLPELFCGLSRAEVAVPVPYPTSCAPQAWAAAAPLEVVRSLLRLEPDAASGHLRCSPAVPQRYLPLLLRNLRFGDFRVRLEVTAQGCRLDGGGGPAPVLLTEP
ncbi:MAG TPA: amylo-alpha-1,6-glucosidase, partial [Actinomycetales bacterium]|nr:amylo-alpha-1,6-glucosidase [Actinomycetales bacterium]